MAGKTIIRKLHDVTVLRAVEKALTEAKVCPTTHYVKELVPRIHDYGWIVILEPRSLMTPPAD